MCFDAECFKINRRKIVSLIDEIAQKKTIETENNKKIKVSLEDGLDELKRFCSKMAMRLFLPTR